MPLDFGSWEKNGEIHTAIRFPLAFGGVMLIQVSVPAQALPPPEGQGMGVAGVSTTQKARLALGIPLAALGIQELVGEDIKKPAGCVGAAIEAIDQVSTNPTALEALRMSQDPDVTMALKFLGL